MSQAKLCQDLQDCRPRPQQFFVAKNIALVLLLLALATLSVLSLATFFRDLYVLQATYRVFEVIPLAVLSSGLFELLIIGLTFFLLGYFLYRTTDWYLVRRTRLLLTLGLLLGLTLSGLLVFSRALDNTLDQSRRTLTSLPHRTRRARTIEDTLRARGYLVGRITEIDEDTQTLTISTIDGPTTLQYDTLPSTLQPGDVVRIESPQSTRIIRITPIDPMDTPRQYSTPQKPRSNILLRVRY